MKSLHKLLFRLQSLFRKARIEDDLSEEIRTHLEMQVEANIAAGMSPDEARAAARREFGRVETIKEDYRDARGLRGLEKLGRDLRFGLRQLAKSPTFAVTATLTLALCFGANVVIFAVVDAILLRPLPFHEADRLIVITKDFPRAGAEHLGCSLPNYYDYRESIAAFASASAIRSGSVVIGDESSPRRVACERVTSDFLQTIGVKPAHGRFFSEEEMDPAHSKAVVLTDTFWRSELDAAPDVLGHDLRIDGQLHTIVGLLPPGFRFLSSDAKLFLPLASSLSQRSPDERHNLTVQLIARLEPANTLAIAQAQVDALDAQQLDEDPHGAQIRSTGFRSHVAFLHADHVRAVRPTLVLLQAGALFLLVVGSVNLINLLLIRAGGRAREFAIRKVLGAGRRDVAFQVLAETILLSTLGGAFGLIVGAVGIDLLPVLGMAELPLGTQVAFDGRVAAIAWLGSLLVGVALALPVVWLTVCQHLVSSDSRNRTASRGAQRLRHSFVVAQIALAFVLLVGAGLLSSSLRRVLAVSPGFQPEQVVTGQIGLPKTRYPDGASRLAFCERFLEELRTQPGVSFAAISITAPFVSAEDASRMQTPVAVEGSEDHPESQAQAYRFTGVVGDYWSALAVPLRAGRWLQSSDQHNEQRVCVVDEAFAQRYWPKGDAIGHRLTKGVDFVDADSFTIVGIVGQVKQADLTETSPGVVYFPYRHFAFDVPINIIVRTQPEPTTLAPVLHKAAHQIDPELPVDDIRPMQARIGSSLVQRGSTALLASLFAVIALLLAAVGTYGVLAYAVEQRRRELGIRLAVGAQRSDMLCLVLRDGLRLVAYGLVFGLTGSLALPHVLDALLFGISAQDPGVFASIALLLLIVTTVACLLPALRATRVEPMETLRAD